MLYNLFGFAEDCIGKEGEFYHLDHHGVKFLHSSFLKEWADLYLGEVNTVFDIGAFEGGDSLRFTSWYPKATIYSFEATKNNFNIINKKLGDKHPNIKVINKAMSSTNGIITLHQLDFPFPEITSDTLVMGSIYTATEKQLSNHGQKQITDIQVESVTFDTFCEENGITEVDIMHIDIEGATFNVCMGMNKILPKMIFTEKENNKLFNKDEGGDTELIKLLCSKGYKLVKVLNNDFLFVLK